MLQNTSAAQLHAMQSAPQHCARTRQCERGARSRDRQWLGRVRAIVAEHPYEHLLMPKNSI